jgi:hypothetical protein
MFGLNPSNLTWRINADLWLMMASFKLELLEPKKFGAYRTSATQRPVRQLTRASPD